MSDSSIYDDALAIDHDRALTALFLPTGCRAPAMALLLFNAELARIPAIVNDPTAGLFRFQYWRDAILGDRPSHGAWQGVLRMAIETGAIDASDVEALIDARAMLLDGLSGEHLSAIEQFVRSSSGLLQTMIAKLVTDDQTLIARAEHAGTAYGIAGFWPAIAAQLRDGQLKLPDTLLQKIEWRQGMRADANTDQRVAGAISPLRERADHYVLQALNGALTRDVFGAIALARIARWQLKEIAAQPESVMAASTLSTPPWAAPVLACRRLLNRP